MDKNRFSVPMDKIHKPHKVLRHVQKDSIPFEELRTSIQKYGIIFPLVVRVSPRDPEHYELIDGLHRYLVAQDLHFKEAPCILVDEANENDLLSLQVMMNATSIPTHDVCYAKRLKQIIKKYEDAGCPIRLNELADMVCKSSAWVSSRLSLMEVEPEVLELFEKKKLRLGHIVVLAKLKNKEVQVRLAKDAVGNTIRELDRKVGREINQRGLGIFDREAERLSNYTPILRTRCEVLDELQTLRMSTTQIVKNNIFEPLKAAEMVLEWVLQLDEDTLNNFQQVRENRLTRNEVRDILMERYKQLRDLEETRKDIEQKKSEKLEDVKERIASQGRRSV